MGWKGELALFSLVLPFQGSRMGTKARVKQTIREQNRCRLCDTIERISFTFSIMRKISSMWHLAQRSSPCINVIIDFLIDRLQARFLQDAYNTFSSRTRLLSDLLIRPNIVVIVFEASVIL